MGMMMEEDGLYQRLRQLEIKIEEAISRVPPHSTKVPIIIELLALEDEKDMLLKKLSELG
jgi:hypothetical protein